MTFISPDEIGICDFHLNWMQDFIISSLTCSVDKFQTTGSAGGWLSVPSRVSCTWWSVLLCLLSVAGEESHRDERGDGRLCESVLHLSVQQDPQTPRGNGSVPETQLSPSGWWREAQLNCNLRNYISVFETSGMLEHSEVCSVWVWSRGGIKYRLQGSWKCESFSVLSDKLYVNNNTGLKKSVWTVT